MTLDRRDHRAASAMPQYHHDSHAQMLDRVVEAFDHNLVGDVARHAHDEHVAESTIKIISGGVRESEHASTEANGCCPLATSARRSGV